MVAITWQQANSAAEDLGTGIRSWRLSRFLAWQDIKQRYRRSTLGPIWLTLSFGVQMLSMGVLSAFLLGSSLEKSLPHVCAGMLMWALITQMINDGAGLFVTSAHYITQIRCPFTVFLMQIAWRNLIITGHNSTIYLIIAAILVVVPSSDIWLLPLGLALDMLCLCWIALVTAVVSARYRDVPLMVLNILNILFWFTPLMYFPEQLGSKRFLADYNPFTHMIALVREPLLGGAATFNDWLIVVVLTILGWAFTFAFFARFRARVVYWL